MGASHPAGAERLNIGKDGAPAWFYPPGVKTKYDFPRAKEGQRDRLEFRVGERHPGKPKRLDKFLQERFPGYSRSFLQKMIKDEKVLINDHATKSNWHVSTGEMVTILLYPAGKKVAEEIAFEVLHRDEHIMAVAKPAKLLVHPARGHKTGTLYNGLLYYFREELAADPSFHIGTVHRLDEETSGVMIYALSKKAHKNLTRQFEKRLIKKTYLCLAHGAADFEETLVSHPLGVDPENRVRMAVNGLAARTAQTRFVKVAVSARAPFTLLRAYPLTGRTHQIRAHAATLHLPLAGDPLYGGAREIPALPGVELRVCLHAETLHLTHPATNEPFIVTAPLPADFQAVLEALELNVESRMMNNPSDPSDPFDPSDHPAFS
jgi:23S rRNA pseudouridine1911/1915/1917 synthase